MLHRPVRYGNSDALFTLHQAPLRVGIIWRLAILGMADTLLEIRGGEHHKTMRTILFSILLCGAVCFSGCIQHSSVEQRVVELPADNPDARLDTAAKIGQALIASGFGADVRRQFPSLTQQQFQGLYLTWRVGDFQGKKSVFFLTGIRYTGTLPDAKGIADYCESRVNQAVAARFSPPPTK